MRSEIARSMFSLEEGLKWVNNKESIAIPSDANLASFRNIKEINDGSKGSILELITTFCCRIASMVCVQSCTPA